VSCSEPSANSTRGCPYFDQIAFGAEQVCNATAPRGRNLHHRLVGLDRHKRLISDNMIALINVPSDNLSLFEPFTEIRQEKLTHANSAKLS
jgi:hypothetical protein